MKQKKMIALLMGLMMSFASVGVLSACGGEGTGNSSETSSPVDTGSDPIIIEYKVKFETLGGSTIAPQSVKNGAKATKPDNPTRDGYDFVEWQLNGKTYDFDARVTGDITLKAKWEKKAPTKFTVSFVVDGEDAPFKTVQVEDGKKVSEPNEEPTKAGFFFDGWTLEGEAYDFETPITEAIVLTAKWVPGYTVTFDAREGTAVEPAFVKEGTAVNAPAENPTCAGFFFEGWTLDGEAYNFETPITANVTLVAKWAKACTVTFESNEAVEVVVKEGTAVAMPNEAPTQSGFVFDGWMLDGVAYDFETPVVSDITLTASWKPSGIVSEQIGVRINGWTVTGQDAWMSISSGDNGEMAITTKFQANGTYSPALIYTNMQSKEYYESLIANGYTYYTFTLAVEGDVTDLYVFGKKVADFAKNADGAYEVVIATQMFVTYYDTMSTIATSKDQVGQASSLAAKFISWKSPADDYASVREYKFTISDSTVRKGVMYSNQIGVHAYGWNQSNNATYYTATNDENKVVANVQFAGSTSHYPAMILRNLQEKSYYENLLASGYTKLTFNLMVGGDNAANVSDLYVFGKELTSFAKNASGAYEIAIDLQYIVTNYDKVAYIGTKVEAKNAELNYMFLAWKSTDWTKRNYVFTLSGFEYSNVALTKDDIGARINGWSMALGSDYCTIVTNADGGMMITTKFQANGTYSPALIMRNLKDKAYYQTLIDNGYEKLTFTLSVEGDVTDLYVFGKKLTDFAQNADGAYEVVIATQMFVTYYDTMSTIATSKDQVGQASSLAAKFISWKSPADDYSSVRNYTFTISNAVYVKA